MNKIFRFFLALTFASLLFLTAEVSTNVTLPQVGEAVQLASTHVRGDLRQYTLKAIAEAQESILLIIFSLKDEQVIALLRKKAEEGCTVRVICDAKASAGVNKVLGPAVSCTLLKRKGLLHQKILVIDRSLLLIGSANMTTESLRHHGNLLLLFRDSGIAENVFLHADQLVDSSARRARRVQEEDIGGQTLSLHLLPADKEALKSLIELLDSAERSIEVAIYTFTSEPLSDALIRAHERGVAVRVIVDRSSGLGASKGVCRKLKEAGILLALSDTAPLLHYKCALIDNKVLVAGSANWTKAAFHANDDCMVVLQPLTAEQLVVLSDMWEAIWLESKD